MKHFWHRWNYHRKHLRTCRICHRHEEARAPDGTWTHLTCKEYNIAIDYWVKWERVHNYEIDPKCKYLGSREIPPKPWPIYIDKDSNYCPHPREERPTEIHGRSIRKEQPNDPPPHQYKNLVPNIQHKRCINCLKLNPENVCDEFKNKVQFPDEALCHHHQWRN